MSPKPHKRRSGRATGAAVLGVLATTLTTPVTVLAQDQALLLAQVLLEDSSTYEGGSLFGPSESRGTWYSFGDIHPVGGNALVAFSTGDADGPPQPGTDLGVLGAADDRSGMNLSLRVPGDAHSLRLSYCFITPEDPDQDSYGDEARVLLAGELLALDPWTLSVASVHSAGLREDSTLNGTWYESPAGRGTAWTEIVVPVSPDDQLLLTVEVEDDPASDLGDVLFLVDRLSFDSGAPELGAIRPGRVPLVNSVWPTRIVPSSPTTLTVGGRDLPGSGAMTLELQSSTGAVVEIPETDIHWISAERIELSLPPLEDAQWGIRLSWDGGVLLWADLFESALRVPRIETVTPATGPPEGGGLALIAGVGFDQVSSLRWAGEIVASYSVHSPQQIELVIPPGNPGPVDLSIFAAGGWDEAPAAYRYGIAADDASPDPPGTSGTPPGTCSQAAGSGSEAGLLLLIVLLLWARRPLRALPE